MGRGMGRVQRACLSTVDQYERDGRWPTTFNIAAEVYAVPADEDGNRWVTEAQHVAVKRALRVLQRKGLLIGLRLGHRRSQSDDRMELCYHWMTETGLAKYLAEQRGPHLRKAPEFWHWHPGLSPGMLEHVERIEGKARAIGMKVPSRQPDQDVEEIERRAKARDPDE